jgi:RNA polymerase sigma-70 factor (ECF subfamily)
MPDEMQKLVQGISQGDAIALEELLQRSLPGLQRFIRLRAGRLLLAREESSDLVQSTCREILQHMDRFHYESEEAFQKWLYATALRKILDRARYYQADKRDADRETTPGSNAAYKTFTTPSQCAMSREELTRVQEAYGKLPPDYREIILLSRVLGLPHAEISQQMGRSEGAVRVLLSRALARLSTIVDAGPHSG